MGEQHEIGALKKRIAGLEKLDAGRKQAEEGSNYFEWTHKRIGGEDFPETVLLTRVESEKGKG
ncbi:MAG: hypothetical protein ABH885_07845 [Candidatus Omnitrophota bacterium]